MNWRKISVSAEFSISERSLCNFPQFLLETKEELREISLQFHQILTGNKGRIKGYRFAISRPAIWEKIVAKNIDFFEVLF